MLVLDFPEVNYYKKKTAIHTYIGSFTVMYVLSKWYVGRANVC